MTIYRYRSTNSFEYFALYMRRLSALNIQVNVTANSAHFDDLEPGMNFTARATSFNKFGSSPPSLSVTFETLPENGNIILSIMKHYRNQTNSL